MTATPTIQRVLEAALTAEPRSIPTITGLAALARTAETAADEAWTKASEAGARGDTVTYYRGRARMACELLGDTTGLWWYLLIADQLAQQQEPPA